MTDDTVAYMGWSISAQEQIDGFRREVRELRDENAKLRELTVLQSVIFKHMSTCPTTDCQVCPVNDECAESVYLEGVLGIDDKETSWLVQWRSEDAVDVQAENAKLRELVADVLAYGRDGGFLCADGAWSCPHYQECFNYPVEEGPDKYVRRGCRWLVLARELGVEVDG